MTVQVLHILGSARPEGASIARMVGILGEGIDARRFRLHAWFLEEDGPLREELEASGVSTRYVAWPGGMGNLRGAAAFWRALRGGDFAIVHQHYGGRSIRLVTRAATRARIACHLWGRVDERTPQLRLPIERKTCDRLIACSRSVAEQVVGARAKVVYAAVKPGAAEAGARLPRERLVIGAASRMVPSKGLDTLIDAAEILQKRLPSARVEIAGDGPEREALARRAAAKGLDNVVFLGWRQQIEEVLDRWDVFVQPSLQEPLGIANLEAMRQGIPVVGSRTGGIAEVVVDCVTGILFTPGDAQELAQALERLALDERLRHAMGDAARRRALEVFSRDAMVAALSAVYDEMLAA
jgi:glycosyltransferase involved in cell wall biosynthesis